MPSLLTFIGDDQMVSVNLEAKKTINLMIENAEDLNIAVHKLKNGSTGSDA